jgi:hypothetical protein
LISLWKDACCHTFRQTLFCTGPFLDFGGAKLIKNFLMNACAGQAKSKILNFNCFFGCWPNATLLLLQEARNSFLAVFGHAGDDVAINSGLQCLVEGHSVHLVKQLFNEGVDF